MARKKRSAIKKPAKMPEEFELRGKRYRWYRNLARSRKRYLISLFRKYPDEIIPVTSDLKQDLIEKRKNRPLIVGLCFVYWDERAGPKVLGKWPSSMEISLATIMQIYANYIGLHINGFFMLENDDDQFCAYQVKFDEDNCFFLIMITQNITSTDRLEISLHKTAELIKKNPHYLVLNEKKTHLNETRLILDYIIEFETISRDFLKLILKNLNHSLMM